MKERVLRVGKPVPLIGVVTEPQAFDPERAAVIVLNSGIMHHVGACRLSVKITREVASKGFLAARFDYSGIGDSEPRRGTESFEEVSLKECAEVMDYLERTRGVKRFILAGLCSGADAAYNTALEDKRVIAIAQIDAFCYVTPRYYLEYYRPILFRRKRWASFLNGIWGKVARRSPGKPPADSAALDPEYFEVPTYTRVFPPREQVARGLSRLTARGVRMYVNFTGGEPSYRYRGQYRASFPEVAFGDLLTVDYYPHTNHIITQPRYQREIVSNIRSWVVDVDERSPALAQAIP